ncbi:hypothetical protein [Variovorax sp. YR752]|uniref:hypothetical protein n=1 Tax=Variovorax sp. YR752 TaxID=1884383 RepID=UPI0031377B6B
MTTSTTFAVALPSRARWALSALHGLVALVVIAWAVGLFAREAWAALGWVLLACLAWLPAVGWRPLAAGRLRWDGQTWWLAGPSTLATPECEGSLLLTADTGNWMLLRFRHGGLHRHGARHVWLVLGRDAGAGDWNALRRAVYSPRPEPAAPSAQAPDPLYA